MDASGKDFYRLFEGLLKENARFLGSRGAGKTWKEKDRKPMKEWNMGYRARGEMERRQRMEIQSMNCFEVFDVKAKSRAQGRLLLPGFPHRNKTLDSRL